MDLVCSRVMDKRSTLGWEPKVPLEAGLERTVAYFSGLVV